MIIDKSVILSILNLDEDAERFAIALENSEKNYISAVNYFEVAAFVEKKYGDAGARELDNFLKKADITIYQVDDSIIELAREGYRFYSKGKTRETGLALGDYFAYATAKFLGQPLLFKGDRFINTDITAAG